MVLLLDNYDSFTYNLYDYIAQLGKECKVVRNDAITLEELDEISFESIVISPGPCTPIAAGITNEVIRKYTHSKPILGVCLGHQAIGEFFGANLVKTTPPVHGKTSKISVTEHPMFNALPNTFEVMRYHSLALENLPECLSPIASTSDGINMAFAHKELPLVGVQFHPESILTTHGLTILKNWFEFIGK